MSSFADGSILFKVFGDSLLTGWWRESCKVNEGNILGGEIEMGFTLLDLDAGGVHSGILMGLVWICNRGEWIQGQFQQELKSADMEGKGQDLGKQEGPWNSKFHMIR